MARQLSSLISSLNGLKAFEAAARHLSFTDAAEELFVTQGAVSRQIKALEERLGVKLFYRLTRRVELTESGQILFPATRNALDELERAILRLNQKTQSGILTISVLPTLAMNWLMPRLHEFNEMNPSIEVHLMTSIRKVDFAREDIHLAIRVGRPRGTDASWSGPRIDLMMVENWDGVRAECLMPDEMVPVVAPSLLEKEFPLGCAEDLRNFTLLHVSTRANAWPDWIGALGIEGLTSREGPSFGHFFLALQAAKSGQGVALVPRVLALPDLAVGQLIIPFEGNVPPAGNYYLLCRDHHWDVPRIRIFRKWLIDICRADLDGEYSDFRNTFRPS